MNNKFIRKLDQSKYLDDVYLSRKDIRNKFTKIFLENQGLQSNLQLLYKPLLELQKDTKVEITAKLTDLKKNFTDMKGMNNNIRKL